MSNKLPPFHRAPAFVLGAAILTSLSLSAPAHAQSMPAQPKQAVQNDNDDITRRDLARFDQFLDSHRDVASQLRKTPSLIDDPQFLQNHPELNTYLQDHPSVKQEISERPDTFMRLEDQYDRDHNLRDRDARWDDHNGDRRDNDADHRDGIDRDHDADRDPGRRDLAGFDRFLDEHREIGEQVRKDPSLVDNRSFVDGHPALQTYLRDHPEVRDQLRQDPNAFMHQDNRDDRASNGRDFDDAGRPDRDADRREAMNLDRFLDQHREIAQQVRKDPSLLDNRSFVDSHPALQAYLHDNPGVRDQLRQDPNAFMQQADRDNRDFDSHDRDAMHDHMADFGGFLGNHSDIQRDLSRDPSKVKDHDYVQNHTELNAYLTAHPDVRNELMANPQDFVHGAQQYTTGSGSANGTAGVSGRGTGSTGSTADTPSATPSTPAHNPKPNQ
jgi:hypothetical protein